MTLSTPTQNSPLTKKLNSPLGPLSSQQKLCDLNEPYLYTIETENLFLESMREIIDWHCERSPFYSEYCKRMGFRSSDLKSLDDLEYVPSVWAHFFKTHELLSVDRKEIFAHLTSSGTQGQKSQVFFDFW